MIVRWWKMWPTANIGIDLARAGLVDVAPDSLEWFAEFTARGGLPSPLRFASGGGPGHVHHLYARPDGCATYRDTHSGEYDVMSAGYAVMPPSLHRSGRYYAWETTHAADDWRTDDAPTWVVELLNKRSQRVVASVNDTDDDGPPVELRGQALERWHGRLFDARPDGLVDRSLSLWRLSTILLEAGLSRTFVEDLIETRDVALGWTKFTNRRDAHVRYRVIVDRAVAGQGPGRIRLKPKPPPSTDTQYTFYTAAELEDIEDVELTWFVFKYIACGVITELDGKVKQAGKTTFIAAMVRAILEGEPFLGERTMRTPVMYLTEQTIQTFKRALGRGGLRGIRDLHILFRDKTNGDPWPIVLQKTYAHMQQVGARLLVVDTLGQFSGAQGDDENKAGSAMKVMEPLQDLAAKGIAVLISRHDRKSGGEVGDSGRGSSATTGANDIILHLQRLYTADPSKKRQRELKTLTRLDEIGDLIIELSADEPYAYHLVGEEGEVRTRDLRVEIQAALPLDEDDAIHRDELFSRVAGREIDKARVLRELVREHLVAVISKTPEGKQRPRDHYYQRIWGEED